MDVVHLCMLGASAVFLSCVYLYFSLFIYGTWPPSLPCAPLGERGLWAWIVSPVYVMPNPRKSIIQHLSNESHKTQPYLLSTILFGPTVILPPTDLKWLCAQPEAILSAEEMHSERFQLHTTLLDPARHATKVVNNLLPRFSKSTIPALHEELSTASADLDLAIKDNWSPLCIPKQLAPIIAALSSRMLVGLPHCRDREYLELVTSLGQWFIPSALVIRVTPRILQPAVKRLARLVLHRYLYQSLEKRIIPMVADKLARKAATGHDGVEENTFLQWYIDDLHKGHNEKPTQTPRFVASYLISVNLAAIPTTLATATKVLNNILTFEHAEGLIHELREEFEFLAKADHDAWTWAELHKLALLDSVIKETLRMSPIEELGFGRLAMKDTTNPAGFILKQGTKVALTTTAVHYNEAFYSDPSVFDPYRHLRMSNHATRPSTVVSEEYLGFGFPKHTCPGRWFAVAQMKIMVIHLLNTYDLRLDRPAKFFWMGSFEYVYRVYPALCETQQKHVS